MQCQQLHFSDRRAEGMIHPTGRIEWVNTAGDRVDTRPVVTIGTGRRWAAGSRMPSRPPKDREITWSTKLLQRPPRGRSRNLLTNRHSYFRNYLQIRLSIRIPRVG